MHSSRNRMSQTAKECQETEECPKEDETYLFCIKCLPFSIIDVVFEVRVFYIRKYLRLSKILNSLLYYKIDEAKETIESTRNEALIADRCTSPFLVGLTQANREKGVTRLDARWRSRQSRSC